MQRLNLLILQTADDIRWNITNFCKQGSGIFPSSLLSSLSRAPESMNIIAEVEERRRRRDIAYIAYILLLLHLRTSTLGTSCAMDMVHGGIDWVNIS